VTQKCSRNIVLSRAGSQIRGGRPQKANEGILCAPKICCIFQWCGRVIFVESWIESSYKPFKSESRQSHLKLGVRVESWLGRVTKTVAISCR